MATYTVTLSKKYPELATYSQSSISYITDLYYGSWSPYTITVPKWKSGAKTFGGYYSGSTMVITSSGLVVASGITHNASVTESWSGSPIAVLNDGNKIVGELVYDGGVWYQDFKNKKIISYDVPYSAPIKENYRFLGIYSKNSIDSTQYVDAEGRPTQAFTTLSITSDKTFYLLYKSETKTITISASNGTWNTKKFYQRLDDGVYTSTTDGYYEITSIDVPVRECWRWDGAYKTSSASSTLYINPDGTFTDEFLTRPVAAATIYGNNWTQVSYKITMDATGGDQVQDAWYIDKTLGGVYADDMCQYGVTQFPMPYRAGYYFDGYFSAKSGGIRYTDDGSAAGGAPTILDSLKTVGKSVTIYAQWRKADVTITLDPSGGKAPTDYWYNAQTIYYDNTTSHYYNEYGMVIEDSLTLPPPTYVGNVYQGYYTQRDGGDMTVDTSGHIVATDSPASDVTWYAHWRYLKTAVYIDAGDGSGGTSVIYYYDVDGKLYSDADLTTEISSITLPTKQNYDCDGIYDADGNMLIDSDGVIILSAYQPSGLESDTIYARYTRRCYQITLDPNGGTTDIPSIYYAVGGASGYYSDEYLTHAITSVDVHRVGYTYDGMTYGDTVVVSWTGQIMDSARYVQSDYTATAQWTVVTYTLHFQTQGGTVPYDHKYVMFGAQIGQLPKPTWQGHKFICWTIDGVDIKTATKYSWGEDKTAIAKWETSWSYMEDYWGLASDSLVPIHSDDGSSGEMIHTADGSTQYKIMPHPTVTYMVVGQVKLKATLGDVGLGSYMLTQITVDTRLGQPPTVTASGVANEGRSAVQMYKVDVSISPRHRAQRLDSAVVGGGELQSCTYAAKCDPVVVYDVDDTLFSESRGMIVPIASDVVHGIATVQATTAAYDMESAPTAGNGYTATQIQQDVDHIGYKAFNITVEKEI